MKPKTTNNGTPSSVDAICSHSRFSIRWLIRNDMPKVMAIEQTLDWSWTHEDYMACLRQRNCIGMVARTWQDEFTEHDLVHGQMVYALFGDRLRILRFVVPPKKRRQGIGAAMFAKLVNKLSQQRHDQLVFVVRETEVGGQMFLKAMGCHLTQVRRSVFGDEDGYEFVYSLRPMFSDAMWHEIADAEATVSEVV